MLAEPCRFVALRPGHECVRYDGSPVRGDEVCFYEAATQVRERNVAAGVPDASSPRAYQLLAGALVARDERAAS